MNEPDDNKKTSKIPENGYPFSLYAAEANTLDCHPSTLVIPAQAGIQSCSTKCQCVASSDSTKVLFDPLGSCLPRNDENGEVLEDREGDGVGGNKNTCNLPKWISIFSERRGSPPTRLSFQALSS